MILRRAFLAGLSALCLPFNGWAQGRRKEVLAFYYGWYGVSANGDYEHWERPDPKARTLVDSPNYPVTGPYDSLSAATITRHVDQARQAGLTGLIASWWGPSDRTDRQLRPLLSAAADKGLSVTAYVERADTAEALAADLLYLYRTYGDHTGWLKVGGKPVIMFFDRIVQTLGLEGWLKARRLFEAEAGPSVVFIGTANSAEEIVQRRRAFDALHIYSAQFELTKWRLFPELWRRRSLKDWVEAQRGLKVTTATIMPGFDDRHLPDRARRRPPVVERGDGTLYQHLWRAAIAAKPDWVLIVSFNEWHEASEIEPSDQNGTRELETTQRMSAAFLNG